MLSTIGTPWMWAGFGALVVVALVVDLVVLNAKGAKKVSFREALNWSLAWVALALVFNAWLWWYVDGSAGREEANRVAAEFFTGYLIEKSLAVDNIFVFLMLFTAFGVPAAYQRRVLVLGVIGAIVLRAIMILIGAWLLTKFHWLLYVFGLFLLVTGVKMLFHAEDQPDLEKNPVLKWLRGHLRITGEYHGEQFSVMRDGVRWFTPLFVVMAMIAITDVIFAVDSIPAIFAVTLDPFIVLTSNVFAILGLRAMYFMLADLADRFHLLKYGLAFILVFIGIKMLLLDVYKIPIGFALAVVFAVLAISMVGSLYITRPGAKPPQDPAP
jgi:tellurite resistance protein TerC